LIGRKECDEPAACAEIQVLRETETKMAEPPSGVTPETETVEPDTFADESAACSDWMYARWVCKRTSDSWMTGRLRSASARMWSVSSSR
jgi:hypothetical protein